ncbi:hypothetical protein RB595_003120 [Gaeumannomyces hyphopodioides]
MAEDPNPSGISADEQPTVDRTPISPSRTERKNSLEQHLMHRPERSELVGRNILPASTAAPALQAHQKELERHFKADTLNDKISHRPTPDELIKKGVLDEDPRTAEEKYMEAIEDEYAKREGGA